MTKKRLTVTVGEENKEWLKNNIPNISSFFDAFVTKMRLGMGETEAANEARRRALEMQRQILKKEIQELQYADEILEEKLAGGEEGESEADTEDGWIWKVKLEGGFDETYQRGNRVRDR